jgi:hypothetical protein
MKIPAASPCQAVNPLSSGRSKEADPRTQDAPAESEQRSRLVCLACDVMNAVHRRLLWVLLIAAALMVVLTAIAIRWAHMT